MAGELSLATGVQDQVVEAHVYFGTTRYNGVAGAMANTTDIADLNWDDNITSLTELDSSDGTGSGVYVGNMPNTGQTGMHHIVYFIGGTGTLNRKHSAIQAYDNRIDDIPNTAEFIARTRLDADYFTWSTDVVANVTLVDTVTDNTDLVTAGAIDTQLSATHGSASWLTGSAAIAIITSPVTESLDLDLVQFDDYLDANGRALTWTSTDGDWFDGDITGAAVTLTIVDHDGTTVITKAGTVDTPTGVQAVSVELTSAETGLLTSPGKQYTYQLLIVDDTLRETEVTGDVAVTLTNNEPG